MLQSTASHCGGSSCRGARILEFEGFSSWRVGSGAWAHGCGARAQLPHMWNPPGPGIEPVSPTLAGRFLTTGPPGKSSPYTFNFLKAKMYQAHSPCQMVSRLNPGVCPLPQFHSCRDTKTLGQHHRAGNRIGIMNPGSITDSVAMNGSKLLETVEDRGACRDAAHWVTESQVRPSH